jgi:glycogen operon protein
MLLAGDELLRTQEGNNNVWCQDNETGWFDWTLVERNHEVLRYTRELIALRRRHPSLTVNSHFTGLPAAGRDCADVEWHGRYLHEPLWNDPQARILACTIAGLGGDEPDLHVVANMSGEGLWAPLPERQGRRWHVTLDTAKSSLRDILRSEQQEPHDGDHFVCEPRSVVVFEGYRVGG